MATEVMDYLSVRHRLTELGCLLPDRIAILPVNFEVASSRSDLRQRSEAATIRTLFRINGVPVDEIFPGKERPAYIQNNAFEWVAPTLFISASLWSENAMAVGIALNILSNYITDYLKGIAGQKKIKLEVVIERHPDYSCKKLIYEGDISGLYNLASTIEKLANE